MRPGRSIRFQILTTCVAGFAAYAGLEAAIRVLDLPDRLLIRDIERELTNATGIAAPAASKPRYGWDSEPVICPPAASPEMPPGTPARTVLFVGDSITYGYGVDVETQSYPMLLCRTFPASGSLRVVNAAVEGFGVDQMLMKLEDVAPRYRPQLIVFAYIPHDLWRPGREVHFGATKPVMLTDRANRWQIIPAPDTKTFYDSYAAARKKFYLGPWTFWHVARNRRYYVPHVYTEYYQELFREIRRRLTALAKRHDSHVLVVRLASQWPARAVHVLDRIATEVFSASGEGQYRFYDSEECVRQKALASGVKYAEEFKYHPGPNGHRIYAACLAGTF